MARNMYPGTCYRCGDYVPAGYGHFERHYDGVSGKRWRIQCVKCASGRTVTESDPLVKLARDKGAKGERWNGEGIHAHR